MNYICIDVFSKDASVDLAESDPLCKRLDPPDLMLEHAPKTLMFSLPLQKRD